MTISFNSFPVTLRTPGVHVEFDPSRAVSGLDVVPYKVLLTGKRSISGGTANPAQAYLMTSQAQVDTLFGAGGQVSRMYKKFRANNRYTEVWGACWASTGTRTVKSFTMAGTSATAAGAIYLYIDGERFVHQVAAGTALATIATNLAAAINLDTSLPVTASAGGGGLVNLTVKWGGPDGDNMPISLNYYQGESMPPGITVGAVTTTTPGVGTYSVATMLAGLGETQYHLIGLGGNVAADILAWETELADRWGPIRQNDGVVFAGLLSSVSNSVAYGASRNSPHSVIINSFGVEAHPASLAAAVLGQVAEKGNQDPARPFQTLALSGILAPKREDRLTLSEFDTLLHNGISTVQADEAGVVRIQRLITTYQDDVAGNPDTAYLNVNTVLTLSLLRAQFRARFSRKFGRHKLAGNDANIGSGQAVITPNIARAEAIALFRDWEAAGYVENVTQFKADLIVERHADNPDRLDILLPPDLVNQLRQIGTLLQFRL